MGLRDIRVFVLLLGLALTLLVPLSAQAVPSLNGEMLNPTTDNGPYLVTHSTRTFKKWDWTTGITLDIAHRPIELAGPSGGRVSGILEDIFMMHLTGAVGLLDWLQVGIDIPVALLNHTINAVNGQDSLNLRMSDIRVEAKLRLLDPDKHGWGIAFIPFVIAPTGSGARLVGNKSFAAGGKFAFESPDFGDRFRMALNVGYELRDSTVLFATEVDDWFLYSLAANIRVTDYFEIIPEAFGRALAGEFFQNSDQSPLEVGATMRVFFLDRRLSLDVGGGAGLVAGVGAPQWRGTMRVAYKPMQRSVKYDHARIPIPNDDLTAMDYYYLSENCPEPDQWQQGVHDDRCEKIYELRALAGKCPAPEDWKQGVHDDACEKVYELQGHDRDNDAVADFLDYCPAEAGPVENRGCPAEMAYVDWEDSRIRSDKILFEYDSAILTPTSRDIVAQIAKVVGPQLMKMNRLYIEGHTDNRGSAEYNQALSRRRAQSVRAFLISQGLPAAKISATGYGLSRPAVSNATEAGQQQNRRVEIRFDKSTDY